MADVHLAVPSNSKACLLATLPSCKIFDPMTIFTSEEDVVELTNLVSSGGVRIWKEGDPVSIIRGGDGNDSMELLRKLLESFVTRSAADPAQNPLPGWLVGGNQGGQRGRGQARVALGGFSYNRGRGVGPGKPAQWQGARGVGPTRPALLTPVVAKSEKCVRS